MAIQKGRSALGEKGQGKGRRNIKLVQEEEYEDDGLGTEHDNVEADCDFDDDEEAVPKKQFTTNLPQPVAIRQNALARPNRKNCKTQAMGLAAFRQRNLREPAGPSTK